MVNLSRLDIFARVATSGSLTKIAVMLDTTPSALSRQIAIFEKECGGRLFHRTGRGVTLTELGESIFPRVQWLLAEAEVLAKQIKGSAGIPAGEVRLGILAATAYSLLPPLFTQLHALYPGVMLHILEGSPGQIDEWIATGHVDIGLASRQGKSHSANDDPLATSESYLIGTKKDAVTGAETVDFSKLHQLPLILAGLPNPMRKTLEQIARRKRVTLRVVMEADSLTAQIALVASGCGHVILPRLSIASELLRGELRASLIVNPRIRRTITLTATSQRPLTLAGRVVFRMIRSIAEDLTGKRQGVWTSVKRETY
jgi:LysR family transcriptional regulator, nitrogen assimilation regulatory protein